MTEPTTTEATPTAEPPPAKRKRGRPAMPPGTAATDQIVVRVSSRLREQLAAAAARSGLDRATFLRRLFDHAVNTGWSPLG